MTPKNRRRLIAAAALAGALAVLPLLEASWFKGPIERAVTERTGRQLTIGALDFRPGLAPRIRVHELVYANPEWAAQPEMLRLQEAEFSVRLLPLLRGRLVLPEVELVKPVVALQAMADGRNNWTFQRDPEPEAEDEESEPPQIGRLSLDQGLLLFQSEADDTVLRVMAETTGTDAGQEPGLSVQVAGRYQGEPVEAQARGGAILAIADTRTPYPLDLSFRLGPTHGTVKGTITGMTALAAADLAVDVAGDSLADANGPLPVALPPTPPYRIRARVLRDGEFWRVHQLDGRVGDSDLSGDVDVLYRGGRARVEAKLVSRVLDLDDLGLLLGAPPQTGPGETASAEQRRQAAQQEAEATLLPDKPFNLAALRLLDADVRLTGQSIRSRDTTPIDDLDLRVLLDHGQLRLEPLSFGVAGGDIVAKLGMDATRSTPQVQADIRFRRLDLRQMFPKNDTIRRATGVIGGHAALVGTGNSFAALLGSANGTVALAMAGGRVSNLVLELAGLDAAEALRLLFRGDRTVQVRCALADLAVRDGVMHTRTMLLDTTDTNVRVDGTIDLRDETLDVTLHPLPKDYSPLALRSPIHVRGSFKDPAIRPDAALLLRGGLSAVLGAVAAPLAAIVPLLESGPGDDVNCERLMAAVERHRDAPAQAQAPKAPPG